jgi:hypothetical protein
MQLAYLTQQTGGFPQAKVGLHILKLRKSADPALSWETVPTFHSNTHSLATGEG